MATVEDVRMRKRIRTEFAKRLMDITALDIQVLHGVVYLRGVVKPVRGGIADVRGEVEMVARTLRERGMAKDVIIDCQFRGG